LGLITLDSTKEDIYFEVSKIAQRKQRFFGLFCCDMERLIYFKSAYKNNLYFPFPFKSSFLTLYNNQYFKFKNSMQKGVVKFFNEAKGFGFIIADETNEEIFVHVSGLVDDIREGDIVTFDTARGRKGINAVQVTLA
jgi:CspA family cold shock protein